jgi:hypothetical protein
MSVRYIQYAYVVLFICMCAFILVCACAPASMHSYAYDPCTYTHTLGSHSCYDTWIDCIYMFRHACRQTYYNGKKNTAKANQMIIAHSLPAWNALTVSQNKNTFRSKKCKESNSSSW